MRVLVACEFSGTVRDAFRAKGHDAWSCDILPCEADPQWHIQGDALPLLKQDWDLMVACPPCTYLSVVGNRHLGQPGRAAARKDALEFFMQFANADIPKKCIENPVGHANTAYRKPDQIVHPYMFGERSLKRTCFWLYGLRPLIWQKNDDLFNSATATEYPEPVYILKTNGKRIHHTEAIKGGKKRSKFWVGIANAMADQWG